MLQYCAIIGYQEQASEVRSQMNKEIPLLGQRHLVRRFAVGRCRTGRTDRTDGRSDNIASVFNGPPFVLRNGSLHQRQG